MAGERTPLFSTNSATPRRTKRVSYAKIAAGIVLVGALGTVLYAAVSSNRRPNASVPAITTAASLGASITDDNWFCGETNFEADYIKLSNKHGDDEYFYWFVPSRSKDPTNDPLVLWLTGGPGGSSMLAMFTENGPCLVDANVTTHWNRYAWTNNANVIWLDQPTNVGFSISNDPRDADFTEADVGANIYAFLHGFLDKHPAFIGRKFFITGESYGGHYVPSAAHYIWQQNQRLVEGTATRINLQGIAIGNGLTNPNIQYKYYQDMVHNQYHIPLLSADEVTTMQHAADVCVTLVEQCQHAPANGTACSDAMDCWDQRLIAPFQKAKRNLYDIRRACSPDKADDCGVDVSYLNAYFALDSVKTHVPTKRVWHELDDAVNQAFSLSGDASFAYHTYVADLLNDGIRVLIYAGDTDIMCNWIGNRAWTLDLDWTGKAGYNAATEKAFETQDVFVENAPVVDAGVVRQFKNFAFVRLYESGHMVPTDQPAVAWELLDKFLNNQQL